VFCARASGHFNVGETSDKNPVWWGEHTNSMIIGGEWGIQPPIHPCLCEAIPGGLFFPPRGLLTRPPPFRMQGSGRRRPGLRARKGMWGDWRSAPPAGAAAAAGGLGGGQRLMRTVTPPTGFLQRKLDGGKLQKKSRYSNNDVQNKEKIPERAR